MGYGWITIVCGAVDRGFRRKLCLMEMELVADGQRRELKDLFTGSSGTKGIRSQDSVGRGVRRAWHGIAGLRR